MLTVCLSALVQTEIFIFFRWFAVKIGTDTRDALRMNHNDDLVILGDLASSAHSRSKSIIYIIQLFSGVFQHLPDGMAQNLVQTFMLPR